MIHLRVWSFGGARSGKRASRRLAAFTREALDFGVRDEPTPTEFQGAHLAAVDEPMNVSR